VLILPAYFNGVGRRRQHVDDEAGQLQDEAVALDVLSGQQPEPRDAGDERLPLGLQSLP
jgi:hypothetical protein